MTVTVVPGPQKLEVPQGTQGHRGSPRDGRVRTGRVREILGRASIVAFAGSKEEAE
jgi:hypothetical protein